MQRMMIPALSEMTAFWKEIPCNPSTRTWERDDGGTPGMKEKTFCCRIRSDFVRQGRWRLAGSSFRRKWGAGAQRCLRPAAPAQAARQKSSAGRCGPAGRREMRARVHSPGHRQRGAAGTDRAGLCAQSDTVWRTEGQQSNQRPEQATRARKQQPRRKRRDTGEDCHGRLRLSSRHSTLLNGYFHFLKVCLHLKSKPLISF